MERLNRSTFLSVKLLDKPMTKPLNTNYVLQIAEELITLNGIQSKRKNKYQSLQWILGHNYKPFLDEHRLSLIVLITLKKTYMIFSYRIN